VDGVRVCVAHAEVVEGGRFAVGDAIETLPE
jgi:hypothetical protein